MLANLLPDCVCIVRVTKGNDMYNANVTRALLHYLSWDRHDLTLMSLKLHVWSLCSSEFPTAATLMVVAICGQS